MEQEEENQSKNLMVERLLGIPLQFRENTSVAISWNEIPEAENIQPAPSTLTQPMSEGAITQARQLFSSPMFSTQPTSSILQTRLSHFNVALATPVLSLVPSISTSCAPMLAPPSCRPCPNPQVVQIRNATASLISIKLLKYIFIFSNVKLISYKFQLL